MADEIFSINNNQENILDFGLSIKGIAAKDIRAKLVIHANEMDLGFECMKQEGDKWTVKLPALPILERTAYPYHFDIIADGYHFEPLKGTINVVGSHDLYVTAPKNPKMTSPDNREVKKEAVASVVVPKVEPTKQREKPIEQIARELMETTKAPLPKKVEEPVVVKENLLPVIQKSEPKKGGAKDQAVMDILKESGHKAKSKPKRRFSIKN